MKFARPGRSLGRGWGLRCAWVILSLSIYTDAFGQTPDLRECARAFYRGEYSRAAEIAGMRLRQFPNDASTRVILARAELAQGNFQEAFEALEKALAADPKNVDALYYLSVVARELSRREYQRLVSLAPDSARVHQLLGEAALASANPGEAETEFARALQANPRSVEVLTELAELKRSQSKFDEAITYYNQAEEAGRLNYDIAYGLGACYTYKQEYKEATEWLRKAAGFAPNSAASRFALGNALFQSGQLEGAIPELKAALQAEPKMKQAYFLLGRAYSKLGRPEEARAALRKLDELNRAEVPSDQKGSTADILGKPNSPN